MIKTTGLDVVVSQPKNANEYVVPAGKRLYHNHQETPVDITKYDYAMVCDRNGYGIYHIYLCEFSINPVRLRQTLKIGLSRESAVDEWSLLSKHDQWEMARKYADELGLPVYQGHVDVYFGLETPFLATFPSETSLVDRFVFYSLTLLDEVVSWFRALIPVSLQKKV